MEKPPMSAPQSPTPSTTFVQTDAATFKELVQRLTAGPLDDHLHHKHPPSPSSRPATTDANNTSAATSHKLSGLKRLHEQLRGGHRRSFTAHRPGPLSLPASPVVFSPSMSPADSPSTSFANLHICDEGGSNRAVQLNEEEEERAIKERRFYLHPSPRTRLRKAEPELLLLFPLSSPSAGNYQP